ncbi:MAG: L,D-transpeptidase [Pseudolabrys sp.]
MSIIILRRVKAGPVYAALLTALAGCMIFPVETANAQFLFGPQDRLRWSDDTLRWSDHTPPRYQHQYRTKTKSAKEAQPQDPPKGPLQIIISIEDQRISLYDNVELIARSSVSTGVPSHPTPLGIFTVISKQRWHRSNIYSNAPMPYMQRITWSGIALHAGVLPGYPASHGCIRLTDSFATRLWHLTKRGTRVIIARGDVRPFEIRNPHLFLSRSTVSGSPESQVATAAGGSITAAATYTPLISDVGVQEATSLQVPKSNAGGAALQKARPISVFVSRKLGKLLVRQDFTPLFDVPVKIQNPEEPLGTHVFTAMASQNEGPAIRWTVVSMPEGFSRSSGAHKERMERTIATAPAVPPTDRSNAALNRIEIPQDAFERISDLITPGSSLIVSDRGMSDETGSDTDFIVEMR